MRDEILYCSDIEQLKQELIDNGLTITDEDGNIQYNHGNILTPIKYNGVKTLSLVRDNKLDLSLFPSLTNLGTYEELFANPDSDALYKDVYPYNTPLTYTEEDGTVVEYLRPKKIGEFA